MTFHIEDNHLKYRNRQMQNTRSDTEQGLEDSRKPITL